MYKELKQTYEKNIKKKLKFEEKKQVQQTFLRECQKYLLETNDIEYLLADSEVESFSYSTNGVYITLNEKYGNLKLYIHKTDIGGAPMWLACFGSYEANEAEMVKKIIERLSENATVFDVGANIGWYSLLLKKCFPGLKVYSFEPAPKNFHRLQRNFQLNNLSEDYLVNAGFYDSKGKMDFCFNPKLAGASSFRNILGQDVENIQVDITTMDAWVKNNSITNIGFIKCDVEGAELFVYKGGMDSIRKYKPVIMSEMLRKWSAKFNYHPNDIIRMFEEIGYECYVITENNRLKKFGYVDEETVETNYFFLHPDVHASIIQELSAE